MKTEAKLINLRCLWEATRLVVQLGGVRPAPPAGLTTPAHV